MSNYVLFAVAAIFMVFANTNALAYIKGLLSKTKSVTVESPKEEDLPKVVMIENPVPPIYAIVEQWDRLRAMCDQAGLKDSVKSLDTVFLNLLNKAKENEKINS